MKIQETIQYLKENISQRIDMLEALRRHSAEVIGYEDGCCLIENKETGLLQLACDTVEAGARVLTQIEPPRLIVAHGSEAFSAVQAVWKDYGCETPCHLAYYPGKEKQEPVSTCAIRPFPMEALQVVLDHYDNITDPAYIRDRIEKGDLFMGLADDQICGFIGFHRDGSMGMLEVFPAFRHRHIGFALERDLINRALDRGWIPYCHIYQGNIASIQLQKKLGLLVSDDCPVAWMRRG